MPSDRFTFIATRTTADFVIPANATNQVEFNRKIHNAFQGLVGGMLQVGDLRDRPSQKAIPNHLLCDGSTVSRVQFPELVEFLNPGGATATLPDYTGAVEITEPTVTQDTTPSGTVQTTDPGSTGAPTTTPEDQGGAGGTKGGNVPSGGRTFPPWFNPGGLTPEDFL